MPPRKVEPTEVTIEYLLSVYIVVRRDEELYGDSDLHIAKVVVDDEAELEDGRGFSPDGRRVVTASYDSTARVWMAATGLQVAVLLGHLLEMRGVGNNLRSGELFGQLVVAGA